MPTTALEEGYGVGNATAGSDRGRGRGRRRSSGGFSKQFWKADCKLVLGVSSEAISDPAKILKPRMNITILELIPDDNASQGGGSSAIDPSSSGILVPVGVCQKSLELRVHKLRGERKMKGVETLRRRSRPQRHFEKPIRAPSHRRHQRRRGIESRATDIGFLTASLEVALE